MDACIYVPQKIGGMNIHEHQQKYRVNGRVQTFDCEKTSGKVCAKRLWLVNMPSKIYGGSGPSFPYSAKILAHDPIYNLVNLFKATRIVLIC